MTFNYTLSTYWVYLFDMNFDHAQKHFLLSKSEFEPQPMSSFLGRKCRCTKLYAQSCRTISSTVYITWGLSHLVTLPSGLTYWLIMDKIDQSFFSFTADGTGESVLFILQRKISKGLIKSSNQTYSALGRLL